MKKFALALLFASSTAMAVPSPMPSIQGVIAFTGGFTDNVDDTTGTGTLDFADVVNLPSYRTGDFYDVIQGNFIGVSFGPIAVVADVITPLPISMWSLIDGDGDATGFVLDTVTNYTNGSSGVEVDGFGTLSLTGFADTRGKFSLDTADNKLTFDADAEAITSPGTMALLGFGLIGLGLARRKVK